VTIMEVEDGEDMETRHVREKKELAEKVAELKKSIAKADKKKKKEVNAEIARLEGDLNEKHSAELMEQMLDGVTIEEKDQEEEENVKEEEKVEKKQPNESQRVSKAQKRRDKKAEKEVKRREEIEAQEQENLLGARNVEQEKIQGLLAVRGLKLHEVPSDGDCMFASVAHQLGLGSDKALSVAELRKQTGNELRRNKSAYWPFLSSPKTGEPYSEEEYSNYCNVMESTPAWGGQVELLALATVLGRPLTIIQGEGQECLVVGDDQKGQPITLTYHRHMYGLGEHYNSVNKL